ncbi:MAG: nuclear transport factor 2 family protein [Chitinophagaceae bacterium]
MAESIEQLIQKIYAGFNKRDIPAVLSFLDPQVHWPNGWEGGYVEGHKAVSDYWTRQWKELDPNVEPVSIVVDDNKADVTVRQVVKDIQGNLLSDSIVIHSYIIENGLIKSMEIVPGEFTPDLE